MGTKTKATNKSNDRPSGSARHKSNRRRRRPRKRAYKGRRRERYDVQRQLTCPYLYSSEGRDTDEPQPIAKGQQTAPASSWGPDAPLVVAGQPTPRAFQIVRSWLWLGVQFAVLVAVVGGAVVFAGYAVSEIAQALAAFAAALVAFVSSVLYCMSVLTVIFALIALFCGGRSD